MNEVGVNGWITCNRHPHGREKQARTCPGRHIDELLAYHQSLYDWQRLIEDYRRKEREEVSKRWLCSGLNERSRREEVLSHLSSGQRGH